MREGELAWYRQDFNTDPEKFWIAADAPDRVGMTEIRYIEGLYAFWDALSPAASGPLDRQLLQRRPPPRPGDDLPQRGPLAKRFPVSPGL